MRTAVAMAACVGVVLIFALASVASGGVHVTTANMSSPTMSNLSLTSTGDAGDANNMVDGTSLATTAVAEWFNQDVLIKSPGIVDPDADFDLLTTGVWWRMSADLGMSWSTMTTFSPSAGTIVSAEGLYSVTATGADEGSQPATGVAQIFGIDKTAPTSHTDLPALPAGDPDSIVTFDQSATVTIMATDTASGVERIQYDLDMNPTDYTYDAVAGQALNVPVVVMTSGFHELKWKVWDNAGNVSSGQAMFLVRPAHFVPDISLGVSQTGLRRRIIRFAGDVSPLPAGHWVTVTLTRKVGRMYKPFAKYMQWLPAFGDDYNVQVILGRAGTWRATTTCAGGMSKTRQFVTR